MATERDLWNNYLFLTREMDKCLDRDDFDLFNELLAQRGELQHQIDSAATGFTVTPEGQELGQELIAANTHMQLHLTGLYNRAKRNQAVTTAYDNYAASVVGNRMDQKR